MNANELLDHATQFAVRRRLSMSEPFIFKPTFYCAIHSIELALKGHLVHQGFSAANLRHRKYGHNIGRLLEKALDDGAVDSRVIDYFEQEAIKWESENYSGKCFEYPEPMLPTCSSGKWLRIAENLVQGLRKKIT